MDQMRYGTRTHCKRRWSRQGRRPLCQVKLGYEWGYLYVALCPYSGDLFAIYFSHLDKACFSVFLQHLQHHLTEKGISKVLLIGDGATAHTAQDWSTYRIDWQKLPTACPELNPVERLFEELRKPTANQVFANRQQVEDCLARLLTGYLQQPEKVSKLTFYPYLNKIA